MSTPDSSCSFTPSTLLSPSSSDSVFSVPFQLGNPSVESQSGIIYLHSALFAADPDHDEKSIASSSLLTCSDSRNDSFSCPIVCLFDVPCHLLLHELHEFLSCSPLYRHVTHSLILAHPQASALPFAPNSFLCLLHFDSIEFATEFRSSYDFQPFNSLEPEKCRVEMVKKVEFKEKLFQFPAQFSVPNSCSDSPCCPVCLEPLDSPSLTPLLTILCNHSFHFDCLSNWRDLKCPVCRYSMKPNIQSYCEECGVQAVKQLWMCVICGKIGCSRYSQGHAEAHYQLSGHAYSVSVENQKVWDYVNEAFVHRLVRDKNDGEIIEIERRKRKNSLGNNPKSAQTAPNDNFFTPANSQIQAEYDFTSIKLEDLVLEFNYLLSSQLEKQRRMFEAMRNERRKEWEREQNAWNEEKEEIEKQVGKYKEKVQNLEKQWDIQQRQHGILQKQQEEMEKEAEKLKVLNEKLAKNREKEREFLKENERKKMEMEIAEVKEKERRIKEAEETLNDLQQHLDTAKKLAKSPMKDQLAVEVIEGKQETNEGEKRRKGRKSRS
jgi:BRCA1-associated protein